MVRGFLLCFRDSCVVAWLKNLDDQLGGKEKGENGEETKEYDPCRAVGTFLLQTISLVEAVALLTSRADIEYIDGRRVDLSGSGPSLTY